MSIFSDISRQIRPALNAGREGVVGYLQGALSTQAKRSLDAPLGTGQTSPPAPTVNVTAPRSAIDQYAKPVLIGVALLVAAHLLLRK